MKRKIYLILFLPLLALSCSKIATQDFNEDYSTMNLSYFESANCYIVSEAGKYKFRTGRGNLNESVGEAASCEVLWESFGTATTPSMSGSECSCGAGALGLPFQYLRPVPASTSS